MTPRYPLPPKQQLTIVRRVAFQALVTPFPWCFNGPVSGRNSYQSHSLYRFLSVNHSILKRKGRERWPWTMEVSIVIRDMYSILTSSCLVLPAWQPTTKNMAAVMCRILFLGSSGVPYRCSWQVQEAGGLVRFQRSIKAPYGDVWKNFGKPTFPVCTPVLPMALLLYTQLGYVIIPYWFWGLETWMRVFQSKRGMLL